MINILYVDDDRKSRAIAEVYFRASNRYNLRCAADATEAIDILTRQEFDFIVTDLQMPIMDGMGLSKYLGKVYPDLPIFICSAFLDTSDIFSTHLANIKGFISKPFSPENFERRTLIGVDYYDDDYSVGYMSKC